MQLFRGTSRHMYIQVCIHVCVGKIHTKETCPSKVRCITVVIMLYTHPAFFVEIYDNHYRKKVLLQCKQTYCVHHWNSVQCGVPCRKYI